jgi:hypothetical protein
MKVTMDDTPIDFSSLDPTRHRARWDARIEFVARASAASRRKRLTIEGQLIAWSRPMLAVAASVALIGSIGVSITEGPAVTKNADPVLELSTWAARDEVPSPEAVMNAFRGEHVNE